eukprot:8665967-Pyramimonas_sp.AAC.1
MAVCRQGIYVEYSMECSKCRALNGILVSTGNIRRILGGMVEMLCAAWYNGVDSRQRSTVNTS